ncbi:MAG: thiamine phosphate synthase [Marinifilaceae bacterium]
MKKIVITSPIAIANETTICNELLHRGVDYIHLRRPGALKADFVQFLELIDPRYRHRVMLHNHFELSKIYSCGVHLNKANRHLYPDYNHCSTLSTSCHSFAEVETLPFTPDYILLSPIFDSISKKEYNSNFNQEELRSWLSNRSTTLCPIIALGGIDFHNVQKCTELGFSGFALLGAIWSNTNAMANFNRICRPELLSIAGFDPCSSAGITADVQIANQLGGYCLGVCSGITIQNEDQFEQVEWSSVTTILQQIEILQRKHQLNFVKIGLIESMKVLRQCVDALCRNKATKIVWDPILKASAGFSFHDIKAFEIEELMQNLYLITPNHNELVALFDTTDISVLQEIVQRTKCNILWKGGHKDKVNAEDILVTSSQVYIFQLHRSGWDKHGTGCAFSTAVTTYLAQGICLHDACAMAQKTVSDLLNVQPGKLIFHPMINNSITKINLYNIPLQYITDHKEGVTVCEQVELACRGGVKWIQLRMKEATTQEWLEIGSLVKSICLRYGSLFIINDHVDIARQLDADGVHLGKEDMDPRDARKLLGADKIIGATCNNIEDVRLRNIQQVDYIGLGPFAYTTTKKKLSPILGLNGYEEIMRTMESENIHIPVHAIGGIALHDISSIINTGVHGIALSGLIKNSNHIPTQCQEIISILNNTVTTTIAEKNISL